MVTDAAMAGLAGALDLGAALVLARVGRLHLDGLEYEIFQGAHHRAAVRYREMAARYGELADSAR
jgi:hypothetical protein